MGNCQAAEAATAVLQHSDGKIERLYWPTTADVVMRANPGHYIALATTLNIPQHRNDNSNSSSTTTTIVRLTKLRLLRSKETLALGHVYRLVTSKEVMKALEARKQERLRKQQKQQQQSQKRVVVEEEDEVEVKVSGERPLSDQINQEEAARIERHKQKTAQSAVRARQWRPSLHSISEAVS